MRAKRVFLSLYWFPRWAATDARIKSPCAAEWEPSAINVSPPLSIKISKLPVRCRGFCRSAFRLPDSFILSVSFHPPSSFHWRVTRVNESELCWWLHSLCIALISSSRRLGVNHIQTLIIFIFLLLTVIQLLFLLLLLFFATYISPWCNRNGWLGVKYQVTYLLPAIHLSSTWALSEHGARSLPFPVLIEATWPSMNLHQLTLAVDTNMRKIPGPRLSNQNKQLSHQINLSVMLHFTAWASQA